MAALFSIENGSAVCNGGPVTYLRAGRGVPLVLLHGIGSSAQSWQAQLSGLSGRFDVIAWNAPGYGGSATLKSDAPDAGDYANALLSMLEALGIGRLHLAGHSLGSLIAARFARDHGDRLISLTLASCALGHARLAPAERERLLEARLGDVRDLGMAGMAAKRGARLLSDGASNAMRAAVADTMARLDPHGYGQAARMLSGGDMLADLKNIAPDIPLQIVFGLDDVITPPEANERAASVRAHTRIVRIPAAGHAVYIEQPDAFNSAIVAFAGGDNG